MGVVKGPVRIFLAYTYVGLQLLLLGFGLRDPTVYLRWAPFDVQAEYWLGVEIDGQSLDEEQIEARYREPAVGVEQHGIEHLISFIEQFEQTYGRPDRATVLLRYRVNGGEVKQWHWPME